MRPNDGADCVRGGVVSRRTLPLFVHALVNVRTDFMSRAGVCPMPSRPSGDRKQDFERGTATTSLLTTIVPRCCCTMLRTSKPGRPLLRLGREDGSNTRSRFSAGMPVRWPSHAQQPAVVRVAVAIATFRVHRHAWHALVIMNEHLQRGFDAYPGQAAYAVTHACRFVHRVHP